MLGHQRHASETPFKWCFAGGPMMTRIKWCLDPLSHHQLKKVVKIGPLSGSAHAAEQLCFMCEVRFYAPMHHVLPNS